MTRRLPLALAALVAVVASVALTGSSSASFVSSSSSTGSVSAAADWTAPTVALTMPDSAVKGTTPITATASDDVSGVDTVTIQRAAAGTSTWTTICVARSAPFTCDWATASVADGSYDLRATAVDKAGNASTSTTVTTTVANALTVVLARPGDYLRGGVTVTSTLSNAGTVTPSSVRVEFTPAGTNAWTTVCTSLTAPYTCSGSTTAVANGTYDLRSVAVVGTTTFVSAVVANVVVDNQAPTVSIADPGTPLKGTKTFTTTATDAHSGIDEVTVQASSGGTWTDLCTATSAPFTCAGDTTVLPNGTYSFRAVATDRAGNVTTSTAIANRVVQNTISSVSLTAPRTYLRGTVTLAAQATSTATITSVKIQRSVAGANRWTDICVDTSSPYTCSFATTGVADGSYDLRAVVTTADGLTATSTVVTNRVVDNTAGKGLDIQTTNGGTAGRIDAGDTIVYTFSEQMDLGSIYSGWAGNDTAGTVRVKGGFFSSDTLDVTAPTSFRLGTLQLNADFVSWLADYSSDVTISATTVTIDGTPRTVVKVKILGGSSPLRSTTAAAMVWTPSASVLDLAGNPTSTADVTESGASDVDF